jgi:phosphate starvation-inducible PhoH-like protein
MILPKERYISASSITMRAKKSAALGNIYDIPIISRSSKNMVPGYKPRSENQKLYFDYLNNATIPIVFGIGPAGCGKTLFACLTAIKSLNTGAIDKIILTRPVVPVEEEDIGFLPGTLVKKMDPWTRPIFDIFLEFYSQRDLDIMIQSGIIEISPLAFMRGRTFKKAFIIADEMQNSTPNQMLMLTTRIWDGSKMVITGDLKQSDRSLQNGLGDIMSKIREHSMLDPELSIKLVEMNSSDIERSPVVAKILEMYSKPFVPEDLTQVIIINENKNPDIENPLLETENIIHRTNRNDDAALIPITHMSNRLL